ncbi:MAG: fumarylacetoacetate hydrolase family protein [Gemmatimonadales bacterium]|nr:fumarylacetoacetate hydrolase family protein [Gemmatimonadales bacterium]MYK00731.1 fumarylacetoacetate hydrolase family protein [Candidatus Palauibacter ramosifaciens]
MRALLAAAALAFSAPLAAQGGPEIDIAEPFKVGTFEIDGVPRVGLVLRDALVVDIEEANRDLERNLAYPPVPPPADMIDLIGRYEYGIRLRLYEVVNDLVARGGLSGSGRADFVHDLEDVRVLPPIMYPGKILNAAVNFYSHVNEAGTEEERREARRQRRENRGVPYLFLKPTRGAVIGADDRIVIPFGRDRTDWEVELGAVIGRSAKYVDARDAEDHVFGYTVTIDVSDRGGRPPGGNPMTSDWFVGKGHDTFAPMGPWIVPKEFYGDPMEILRQTLDVGEERMQEATAGDMIHTLWELIEYGSSVATLFPGDVINNGTSGGVGMGTAVRGETRFLQPGEVVSASIDGIGTLTLEVVAETEPPGGTGARLPPVRSYRGNR